jgi:hypothetical protein
MSNLKFWKEQWNKVTNTDSVLDTTQVLDSVVQQEQTTSDGCSKIKLMVKKSRPGWMTDNHYNFCKEICPQIITAANTKNCTSYGKLFLCAFSANETFYGTSHAATKLNNYWGLRSKGGTKDEDYSALTFDQAFNVFWNYLLEKWPDITLFLTKDSYTPSRDVLKEGPYYFTGEEVNQCLNSGRYGGNGYSKTPKIIKANYVCYNAEYYSLNINYGITIMRVMIKFLLPAFQQTVIENFALSKSGCEELVSVFNSYSHIFGVIGVNYDRISQKNYGRYMSEVSYTNQEITPQIARPDSGLSNRILIPNEKNVTIPLFD